VEFQTYENEEGGSQDDADLAAELVDAKTEQDHTEDVTDKNRV
jgi:hypothetical protein